MDRIDREREEGEPWNYQDQVTAEDEEEKEETDASAVVWNDFDLTGNNSSGTEMVFSSIRQNVVWYGSILTAWSIPLNVIILVILMVGLRRSSSSTICCVYPPFRWLTLNFTLVQLANACFVIPLNVITDKKGAWVFGSDTCRAWLLAQLIFVANTFWTLFAMTFDRFLSTVSRRSYVSWSSGKFASVVVVMGSWVISGLALVPSLVTQNQADFLLEEFCATKVSKEHSLFVTLAVYAVPGSLTLIVFGAIALAKLRLQAGSPVNDGYKVAKDDLSCIEGDHHSNRSSLVAPLRDDLDLGQSRCPGSELTALLVVCISCLLTWIPFYIINIIVLFCEGHVCVDPSIWSISMWLGYSCSGLAPIFWFIDPWMRNILMTCKDSAAGKTSSSSAVAVDTTSQYSFQTNASKRSLTRNQ